MKTQQVSIKEIKQQCIEQMKCLKLNKKVIKEFKENNKVYKSVGILGNMEELNEEEEVMKKKFEEQWKCMVYHIINGKSKTLKQYELLFITSDNSTWKDDLEDTKRGYILSQTIIIDTQLEKKLENTSGFIGIQNINGGLVRIC